VGGGSICENKGIIRAAFEINTTKTNIVNKNCKINGYFTRVEARK
jgi:hypothetical protein